MNFSRRQFVKGGVTAFTFGFAAPQGAVRHRVRAGRAVAEPRGRIPERRQRFAEHGDSVPRSVLREPASYTGDSRGQRSADRHRLVRRRARLASAIDRPQINLRRRPSRDRAAHRLREPEPIALHRIRHLGHGEHHEHVGHGLVGPLSRSDPAADRSADRLEHRARNAAAAAGAPRRRARNHEPGIVRVLESEHRRRSHVRAHGADAYLLAHSSRSSPPGIRELDHAGGAGHS